MHIEWIEEKKHGFSQDGVNKCVYE